MSNISNNLFNVVKSHLNNRMNGTQDAILQLEKIGQFIVDLNEISNELNKKDS
jgi:hypothetical protein